MDKIDVGLNISISNDDDAYIFQLPSTWLHLQSKTSNNCRWLNELQRVSSWKISGKSLSDGIDLFDISRFLYPNIDKEEMLKYFEQEERHRTAPDSPTGYIQSEIVMVAKTSWVDCSISFQIAQIDRTMRRFAIALSELSIQNQLKIQANETKGETLQK